MALAMPLPSDGPVVIVDYNRDWPRLYQEERARIEEAMGEWLVEIQHVGSTSVQGLAAKPIVDIMAGVRSLDLEPDFVPKLEAIGYEYTPPDRDDIPDRRYFKRGVPRLFHIHVAVIGGDFWTRHLAFRDYLRAHPETAAEYADLKRRLAKQYGRDRPGYVNAKSDFIQGVEALALGTKATG
jgi:GrpB-like predicted nucleotidyltransferase (UPF0157 family)